jgi:FdhD protein
MNAGLTSRDVVRAGAGARDGPAPDEVAVEEPLEIRVEGRPVAVTMRTPGHDAELAAGFLLTEGVIASRGDLFEIGRCGVAGGNAIEVTLRRPGAVDFARLTRHVFGSSSCGICGKATIDAVHAHHPPLAAGDGLRELPASVLAGLPAQLAEGQTVFQRTGGLHAAALFAAAGRIRVLREDVGRHNAVDKVLGHALLTPGTAPGECGLLVSGRVSFEIAQKALAARVAVVAGISAPTSLAIDFARTSGQALIGFLRAGGHNVYAGAGRLR